MSDIIVLCALIENPCGYLIARRRPGLSNALLWEFPGGKLEGSESEAACLRREFREEFGWEMEPGSFFMESLYRSLSGTIRLRAYWAVSRGALAYLSDHDQIAYVRAQALPSYPLSPADIPLAQALVAKEDGV